MRKRWESCVRDESSGTEDTHIPALVELLKALPEYGGIDRHLSHGPHLPEDGVEVGEGG